MTGYGTTEGKARTIAQAAHIAPAGEKGPRSASRKGNNNLTAESNGIWLCSICHKKVDDDPNWYSVELLQSWKKDHETVIRSIVGKDLETALLELRNQKRYHQECRDLLSFLEGRRTLFEDLDKELPGRVHDSLEIIRSRVNQTRAKVNQESDVFIALNKIQEAIVNFYREIGPETDLRTLRCNACDPVWLRFSEALLRLRSGIIIIMKILAGDAGYNLTWVDD